MAGPLTIIRYLHQLDQLWHSRRFPECIVCVCKSLMSRNGASYREKAAQARPTRPCSPNSLWCWRLSWGPSSGKVASCWLPALFMRILTYPLIERASCSAIRTVLPWCSAARIQQASRPHTPTDQLGCDSPVSGSRRAQRQPLHTELEPSNRVKLSINPQVCYDKTRSAAWPGPVAWPVP